LRNSSKPAARPPRRPPLRLLAFLALSLGPACACDEIPDPDPDGNVLVSDARVDGGADLGPVDLGLDAGADADLEDGGPDAAPDADDFDGGDEDAGPDAGSVCDEEPVATFTATQAVAALSTHQGMIVEITGTATAAAINCGGRACPPEMPCCNTCVATVSVDQQVWLGPSACLSFAPGCSGDECGLVCRPATLGIRQRFWGQLRDDNGQAVLELHQVLP
jgi:hypothetical protein